MGEGRAEWFDTCTGERQPAEAADGVYTSPGKADEDGYPQDFILILDNRTGGPVR
jgi:hypothetical protein